MTCARLIELSNHSPVRNHARNSAREMRLNEKWRSGNAGFVEVGAGAICFRVRTSGRTGRCSMRILCVRYVSVMCVSGVKLIAR